MAETLVACAHCGLLSAFWQHQQWPAEGTPESHLHLSTHPDLVDESMLCPACGHYTLFGDPDPVLPARAG